MAYEPVEHHPAVEEYTETIYELAEDGLEVIQARIAERMGVSRPAVSSMIRRMAEDGLVTVDGHAIELTSAGRSIATTVVRRHRLAERFLTDVLKLSWADAHAEAGVWEHVISDKTEAALVKLLDSPSTCPHGNPIPGSDYTPPGDAMPLVSAGVDAHFVVERIPEELEFAPGQLDFLEASGLMPGRTGQVLSVSPEGATTVLMSEGTFGVDAFAAARVLVSAHASPSGEHDTEPAAAS